MGEKTTTTNNPWRRTMDLCSYLRFAMLRGETVDWNIVKAGIEVLVRWGIYPHLSSGAGIPMEKRFRNKAAVEGLASAVQDHISQVHCPASTIYDTSTDTSRPLYETTRLLCDCALDLSKNTTALRDLVVAHHLTDLFAACLELCSGPKALESAPTLVDSLVTELPVNQAVQAVFMLFAEQSSPPWFKLEAGKVLSRLVMRQGGVVAVIESLVGGAAQGDVQVQRAVATQLARPPVYVATPDQYFRMVCPQVVKLLMVPVPSPGAGESGTRAALNVYQTCVILACLIARKRPQLVKDLLLRPLLEPLLSWDRSAGTIDKQQFGAVLGVHALVTTGHDGAGFFRRTIFDEIRHISWRLLLCDELLKQSTDRQLDNEVKSAVSDICLALVTQPAQQSLEACYQYVLEHNTNTSAEYLSRLLLSAQNWELVICLLSKVFYHVLEGRQQEHPALGLVDLWENMLEQVGTKAFEEDPATSLAFVEELMQSQQVVADGELLMLVFQMIYRLATSSRDVGYADRWSGVLKLLDRILNQPDATGDVKQMAFTLRSTILDKATFYGASSHRAA